jgi:endonuclease/exonuclease/phosphatase family metal-dependent hydrolase
MAISFIRKFAKWFFISLNILICIVFLLACLSPYLNPRNMPISGFLALGLPYLASLLVLFAIFWLIVKPVRVFIPLITLLIGWKQVSVIWAWHPSKKFAEVKSDSAIRIITWNVRGMFGLSNSGYTQLQNRAQIAALINNYNPDLICLQEFNTSYLATDPEWRNIALFTQKYPYYFFARDMKSSHFISGTILFSRYPLIDSAKVKFPGATSESLIYADVIKSKDTLRIFTTHLQSFQFTQNDYKDLQKIKEQDEEVLRASENIYSKMKLAYLRRGVQADMVRKALDKSPYPSIICGDFNDVPNSYTYFHIRHNKQDAFLSASFGIGRSYNAIAPTLRIDYVLPDDNFKILQFDMVDEGLSDHHMLVTDLSLKK